MSDVGEQFLRFVVAGLKAEQLNVVFFRAVPVFRVEGDAAEIFVQVGIVVHLGQQADVNFAGFVRLAEVLIDDAGLKNQFGIFGLKPRRRIQRMSW